MATLNNQRVVHMVTQGYDLPWHKITIRFLLALKAYQLSLECVANFAGMC